MSWIRRRRQRRDSASLQGGTKPDAILPVVMIRLFEEGDAAAVVALSLRAWEPVHASLREVMGDELFDLRHQPDWRVRQRQDVESVLSDEANSVWVAEEEEAVVGFAAAAIRSGDGLGEVLMLAVDPRSQGRGLGTKLTEVATDWIRESGMPVAFISTGGDPGHAPARQTYAKAGYRELPIAYYFKAL
jgi:GNAT superfamily N-acetyltransferase